MRVGSLYAGLLAKEDLQVHTEYLVSNPRQAALMNYALKVVNVWTLFRKLDASNVCRWCVCCCCWTSIHPCQPLSLWFISAVDVRGVECAASQGTPFSSTLSSSTADLRRLQSLGEHGRAFSQHYNLSYRTNTDKAQIHSFRFPDRRKNWKLLQIFVSKIIIAKR